MTAAACKFRVLGGKYVLGDVLGVGGMATVYAATQPSLDRCVAVKMLRPELETNPYMVCRFRNEALAASRLSHPNVASVIDFARTDGGIYYLVMEYVRGRRLTQLLHESGPPTLQRVAVLCDQLLTAVAEVHAAGVVHGDLKADNVIVEVMRDRREFAKLIDFGLASFEGEIEAVVDQPVLAGTPEYLAPEVILGAPTSIASDLYAVGVIIYELITGATPFAGGASAEILARHVGEDVIPPSLRCAQRVVPRRLDMVVCRALAKRPEERFASATEFAQAIAEAIHGFAEPELAAGAHPESKWLATTAPTRDWGPDDAGGKPRRLEDLTDHNCLAFTFRETWVFVSLQTQPYPLFGRRWQTINRNYVVHNQCLR